MVSIADIRPDERGPVSSTIRPRTRPPPVSASSAGDPADSRTGAGCSAADTQPRALGPHTRENLGDLSCRRGHIHNILNT